MVVLHAAATSALSPTVLGALRALLDAAFDGRFTDDDWAHALGGVHVWLHDGSAVTAHGSLVERTLTCAGTRLQAGFVEAVATAAGHRRRGHGTRVMAHIGELIRARYPIGALSTGAHAFYETLGWERWRGLTFVDGPDGRMRTPDDDGDVMILRTPGGPPLDLDGDIVSDWRRGDVW